MALDSYKGGKATNIIVGAAAIFIAEQSEELPEPKSTESYKETLSDLDPSWRNVGYTTNGLELQFAPEFGEVQVDQLLDVAKMFKSGMTVTLNTSFAEATLKNLAVAIAQSAPGDGTGPVLDYDPSKENDAVVSSGNWDGTASLDLTAGRLGECPMERKLVAVGPGPGPCVDTSVPGATVSERVYTAFRVLSIDSVTASAKRDEASIFDVSFRLLPHSGSLYGQIVDRTYTYTPGTP